MKCEDAQLRIAELLSEGKPANSDPEVRAHMASCPECTAYAQDLSEVMRGLLHTEPVEAPAGLKDQLFSKLQGGLSCEQSQTLIVERMTGGIAAEDDTALQKHLETCEDCQGYEQDMHLVVTALPHSAPGARPPAELKHQILNSARTSKPQKRMSSLPMWGLGLAATVTGVLWVGSLLSPSASAHLAPDPSVVISAGSTLIFANSTLDADPIVILDQEGKATRVKLKVDEVPYFTEGVSEGERVYLLDTANQQLVVINLQSRRVEQTHKVHAGASGLSVRHGQVYVKCALSGFLTSINKDGFVTEIKLAATQKIPKEEFMDAVLQQGNLLMVTHHMRGKVFLVNADTMQVQNTLDVGGEPVALAPHGDRILVLDHEGRLLELQGNKITRELALDGHPDKMTIASGQAYLSDRSGQVSKVDLGQWKVVQTATFGTPMDITSMAGGMLAVADAKQGIKMLNSNLQVMEQVE